jgi:hypothetical protein
MTTLESETQCYLFHLEGSWEARRKEDYGRIEEKQRIDGTRDTERIELWSFTRLDS